MGFLVAEILAWVFIVSGSIFVIIGGVGLLRFPDFYTRTHAGGITDTLGAGLLLLGLIFQAGPTLTAVKLVLLVVFIALTSPTAGHALAKAAYLRGLKPWAKGEPRDPARAVDSHDH